MPGRSATAEGVRFNRELFSLCNDGSSRRRNAANRVNERTDNDFISYLRIESASWNSVQSEQRYYQPKATIHGRSNRIDQERPRKSR